MLKNPFIDQYFCFPIYPTVFWLFYTWKLCSKLFILCTYLFIKHQNQIDKQIFIGFPNHKLVYRINWFLRLMYGLLPKNNSLCVLLYDSKFSCKHIFWVMWWQTIIFICSILLSVYLEAWWCTCTNVPFINLWTKTQNLMSETTHLKNK